MEKIPVTKINPDETFNGTIAYEAHGNLYLNITNRCSASCTFCLRDNADGVYGYNLRLSRDPTEEEIIKELESIDLSKYKEIVFTGFGEPTCRLEIVINITRWLHERNCRIRLDTNGHAKLMFPEMDVVKELKDAGLESVSVSLNAESKEKYNALCKPAYDNAYEAVLEFTKKAVELGIRTQMTVVGSLPEVDIKACEKIATDIGATFRIR